MRKRAIAARVSALSALLLFVYSMGYPMRLLPTSVLESAGPLLQFRSLSRFAQPTYFIIVFFCFYMFSLCARSLRMKQMKFAARSLTTIVFIFPFLEAMSQVKHVAENTGHRSPLASSNLKKVTGWLEGIEITAYQGILPVPFFQVGTETKATLYNKGYLDSFTNTMATSLVTGLPLFGSHLSRTSAYQAEAGAALITRNPIGLASMRKAIGDQRPILLLVSGVTDDPDQMRLVEKSKLLRSIGDVEVRRLEIESLLTP